MVTLHLNGSAFVMIDDDAAGSSARGRRCFDFAVITLWAMTPLTVEFDHYWTQYHWYDRIRRSYRRYQLGDDRHDDHHTRFLDSSCTRDVYMSRCTKTHDFQVRLRYSDGSGTWGWYWAVDNFLVDGALTPCTNVRVEVLNDIYGSEIFLVHQGHQHRCRLGFRWTIQRCFSIQRCRCLARRHRLYP